MTEETATEEASEEQEAAEESQPEKRQLDNGNWETECSECGGKAEVPFEPDMERPVLCKSCFQNTRGR